MSRRTWLRSALATAALAACGRPAEAPRTTATASPPPGALALQGGQVFADGAFSQATVVVDGPRIAEADASSTAGARTIDCTSLWLVPGFVDAHVHMQFSNTGDVLAGGVTTVRDLGSPDTVGLALRGSSPLRVLAAGQILTPVGGYPSQSWGSDGTSREVVDAADAVTAVDEQARAGAAVIKVALEPAAGPVFDSQTLRIIVDAARRAGLHVTAHVGDADTLRLALDAGVRELAHLPLHDVTPAEMEAVAAAGVVLVPTLQIHGSPSAPDAVAAFRAAGGVVVFGSDLGNTGTHAGIEVPEVVALQEAGMTAEEVIAAATSVAADQVGLARVGRLRAGAVADLVALRSSPVDDPAAYDDIAFVIAGGAAVGGSLDVA